MIIEITPFDTLFFKDGKPFSMGEDVWASGIFPPSPSVFYGMLRSAFASQKNIPLNDIEAKTSGLKIKSVFLQNGQDILFPYPADFITEKITKDKYNTYVMKPVRNSILSNIDSPFVLKSGTNNKIEELSGKAFVDEDSFKEYLLGTQNADFSVIKLDELILTEPKVGIAKELSTNKTEEGKLYRVGMVRPENKKGKKLKTLIDFENIKLEKEGFLKIGAENKAGYYSEIKSIPEIKTPDFTNNYLKIYLSTPAIFDNGNLPEFIANGELNGIKLKLLTYSMGKPQFIGGFDIKNRKPKPMQKAVPAGSVFYLETDKPKELAALIHGKSISEKYAKEGFGICYCGTFNL